MNRFLLFIILFFSISAKAQTYVSDYETDERTGGSGLSNHDLDTLRFDTISGKLTVTSKSLYFGKYTVSVITYNIVPTKVTPLYDLQFVKEFKITFWKSIKDSGGTDSISERNRESNFRLTPEEGCYQRVDITGRSYVYENYTHYYKQIYFFGIGPEGNKVEKTFYIKK